jgi:hypothetical protein
MNPEPRDRPKSGMPMVWGHAESTVETFGAQVKDPLGLHHPNHHVSSNLVCSIL